MDKEGIQGATFGIMDGVITVLGVMIGLGMTGDQKVTILGILVAGIADALANAAGIHVSEETEEFHSQKEIRKSTIFCFLATIFATFLLMIPLIIFELKLAIYLSLFIGICLLVILGIFVAKHRKINRTKLVIEYLSIGVIVVIISYILGTIIV